MKKFWERYSYDVVKLLLDQFAVAMFGIVLAISIGKAENHSLQIVAGVASIIFYLFLQYTVMWQAGTKARIRIDGGRETDNPLTGLYIALLANIPNFILAVLVTIGETFPQVDACGQIGAVASVIALFWEGMYTGVLTIDVAGAPLNSYWWTYFLIIIPSLILCTVSFYFGVKGYHATNILIAETPEDLERKREEKEKKKHKDEEE